VENWETGILCHIVIVNDVVIMVSAKSTVTLHISNLYISCVCGLLFSLHIVTARSGEKCTTWFCLLNFSIFSVFIVLEIDKQ